MISARALGLILVHHVLCISDSGVHSVTCPGGRNASSAGSSVIISLPFAANVLAEECDARISQTKMQRDCMMMSVYIDCVCVCVCVCVGMCVCMCVCVCVRERERERERECVCEGGRE